MASIYSAAAQGLESGFGMGLRAKGEERAARAADDARAERAQDRAVAGEERTAQRARQATQDKRLATQDRRLAEADERTKRLDEMKMLDSELGEVGQQAAAMAAQYGGFDKIPDEVKIDIATRSKDVRGRRAAARDSFYRPPIEQTRNEAAETWSRIESGQKKIEDLTPDDLYKSIVVQARRSADDFLRQVADKPSRIEQAGLDVEAGIQTGNDELLKRGANVILEPELREGVGSEGPDGSEIMSKSIYQLVPHPQQPGLFVPILEMKVRRDDGSVGTYRAPVTEGRVGYFGNQEAVPKAIDIGDALDRVGRLTAMASFMNRPDVRKVMDAASPEAKKVAADFLNEMGYLGVTPPKKQVTRERVDLGGQVLERDVGASGNITGERRLGKTPTPRQPGGEGPTADERNAAASDRRLGAAVKEGLITADEAREQRRKAALGGSGKGAMSSPADLFKAENTLRDEHTKQSGTFVKIRDAYQKVKSAATNPNAASDIALIFGYMRMLDPDSVVREGEFAVAEKARGVPDTVLNLYNKVIKGERLNDDQRKKFVGEAKKVYGAQRQSQDKLDKTYRGLAERYNLNAENIVQDLSVDELGAQLPQAARSALKEGQVTTFGNGQRWTLKGGQPVQVQ